MKTTDLVLDSLGRVHELIPAVLDGLTLADIAWRPDPEANPIGWLIWHLTRIEDDHLAAIDDREQVWTAEGWHPRFRLPYPRKAHGFRMAPDEVGLFRVADLGLLTGYAAAVFAQSSQIVSGLTDSDLDRVLDARYTPPVTVGIRLVSVMVETAQHVGQAGYLRGLRERGAGSRSTWAGTA